MNLRLAEPGDETAVADLHVVAWEVAHRDLLPDAYLDGLCPEDRARRCHFARGEPGEVTTMFAFEGGVLRGFASSGPTRDDDVVWLKIGDTGQVDQQTGSGHEDGGVFRNAWKFESGDP